MSKTTAGTQFPLPEEYDAQRILLELNHLYEKLRGVHELNRKATSVDYQVKLTDQVIACEQGSITITLARPRDLTKFQSFIIKDESGDGNITVKPPAGKTIDTNATETVGAYGILRVYWNGTNYFTW